MGDRCVPQFSLLTKTDSKFSVSLAWDQERWRLHSLWIIKSGEKSLENNSHKHRALHFYSRVVSDWKKKGGGWRGNNSLYFCISLELFSPFVSRCTELFF